MRAIKGKPRSMMCQLKMDIWQSGFRGADRASVLVLGGMPDFERVPIYKRFP